MKIQNNQSEHLKTVCHDLTLLEGNLRPKTKPSPNERTRRTQKNDPRDTPPQSQEPGKTDIATSQAPSPTPLKHDATDANTAGQRKNESATPQAPNARLARNLAGRHNPAKEFRFTPNPAATATRTRTTAHY